MIDAAAQAVSAAAAENPALADMGTTMTLVRLDAAIGRAWVAHVGDSRLYRLTEAGLSQITTDHTMGAELVRDGRLSEAEAQQHHLWHRLTRVIGCGAPSADAEVASFALSGVSALLLCSDGVSNMIPDPAIADILNRAAPDPRAACTALIDAALAAGGADNATAIVLCPTRP